MLTRAFDSSTTTEHAELFRGSCSEEIRVGRVGAPSVVQRLGLVIGEAAADQAHLRPLVVVALATLALGSTLCEPLEHAVDRLARLPDRLDRLHLCRRQLPLCHARDCC